MVRLWFVELLWCTTFVQSQDDGSGRSDARRSVYRPYLQYKHSIQMVVSKNALRTDSNDVFNALEVPITPC